jgi:DNA repair protein RecO (recombination protein O)
MESAISGRIDEGGPLAADGAIGIALDLGATPSSPGSAANAQVVQRSVNRVDPPPKTQPARRTGRSAAVPRGVGAGRTKVVGAQVDREPAYVLHSYPFSDTSLIVECLTRHHGRIALVAKGARRPKVEIDFSGKNELKNLRAAHWQGGATPLAGDALFMGFYVNELVMKLLARDDPHPALFDAYAKVLHALPGESGRQSALRLFERSAIEELGYGVAFAVDVQGAPVEPAARYGFRPDAGAVKLGPGQPADPEVSGQTLLDLEAGRLDNPTSAREARDLMRALLHHHLNGRPLATRQVLRELQQR